MSFEEANDIIDRIGEYFTKGRCRGIKPTVEELQEANEAFGIEEVVHLCQDCSRSGVCSSCRDRVNKIGRCNFYEKEELETISEQDEEHDELDF